MNVMIIVPLLGTLDQRSLMTIFGVHCLGQFYPFFLNMCRTRLSTGIFFQTCLTGFQARMGKGAGGTPICVHHGHNLCLVDGLILPCFSS